jgi:Fe-S cluster assembly ATP-binding protein
MAEELLRVDNLHVKVEENEILKGLSLAVNKGETHVLMGPNGAGKSTLGNTLMGNPQYQVTEGTVAFNGKNIMDEPVNERAKDGLFMSFQNPLEVPGISLSNFIRSALEQRTGKRIRLWDFRKEMKAALAVLQMDPSYADRDLNVGFSGGEKKKAEILQLLMLKPTLAILDETDSGLDVDAVRTVSRGVEEYQKDKDSALIIITHSTGILSSLHVDHTHILVDGKIVASGDASLVDEINRDGFAKYEQA